MARCEVCGTESNKTFVVIKAGASHVFDSFACAIQALAPPCAHCGCKIIGHRIEVNGPFYCCVPCREKAEGRRPHRIRCVYQELISESRRR
jgi:hypothetical protein